MSAVVWQINALLQKIKGVSTYALVGKSGTGKSFRAKLLAQKYDIAAIIDDGLLIQDDKILAGHSAKREKTYMGAVRAALFDDKGERDKVVRTLQRLKFQKILLLGTSEKMVGKIAARLRLPPPENITHIEDIATTEEIEQAVRSRAVEGKHVIPVPALEVKRQYPRIFAGAVRVFSPRSFARKSDALFEKAVVRPEFSRRGRVSISESALTQLVVHCANEFDPQIAVRKVSVKTTPEGYRLTITIDVPFGTQLTGKIHRLQAYVTDSIARFTGIFIEEASVVIDKIRQPE
ncbi:hypothetical protein [Treponema endosymbiont of Eucomonympha sp.]|uniref:hypothetical protein n=1 Tax=Treponema endosymbiont of Eucomonympha sp. TaxID=1580831 RepID=UPI0007829EE3|nr:hypothetical protein [Treponema endosymbiont of Eucomonympha sp.]